MSDTNKILTIVISPGPGKKRTEVPLGTTVADIVHAFQLHGRQILADGEEILPDAFGTTTIDDVLELWAVGATKGAR
jgi:hypothetical protein